MLRSIVDWLISETAPLVPLLGTPGELSWAWSLFIRSLTELKLSDCGSFRINGFCEESRTSQVLHRRLTGYFILFFLQHWLTLEDDMISTLGLFSHMLGSSSIMALERSLLVGDRRVLWLRWTGLSSDLLVNLSSKLVLFSNECLLAQLFSVKTSSLQEPRTFPSGYDRFGPPSPPFPTLMLCNYLFIFSGAAMLVSKGCELLRE